MRVAVITPYYKEDLRELEDCQKSVAAQTHPCTHIFVSDGFPRPEVDDWSCQHVKMPRAHADYGSTPRGVGALSAAAQGFDAVAFLDADNWFLPTHVESLVQLQKSTGSGICFSSRSFYKTDGTFLSIDPEANGVTHVDTNCYFIARSAFHLLHRWILMPPWMAIINDRVFWEVVQKTGVPKAFSKKRTLAYRTRFKEHYTRVGVEPPADTKGHEGIAHTLARWNKIPEEIKSRFLQDAVALPP